MVSLNGGGFTSAVAAWVRLRDYLAQDVLGGPRVAKLATVINVQKGGTLLWCLALMSVHNNYSPTAVTYTALHGSYGLCWLLKELLFPDPSWQVRVTLGGAATAVLTVLGPYWLIPYWCISSHHEASPAVLLGASLTYVVGVVLMMCSDCQKFFVLRAQKTKSLITDGCFSRIRHPNYLGEMMVYGSFAAVSGDARSFIICGYVWALLFIPNMLRKEQSMSRYKEWKDYCVRAGFLWPKVRDLFK
jgi:protein-S-isoprenylcysteine O-methyltransferase Ste14